MTAVITGVGAVSAFGRGTGALLGALAEGRSGVGPITCFDASTFPVRVAGQVPDADPPGTAIGAEHHARHPHVEPARAGRDRKIGFALRAADEAWRQAGLGDEPGAQIVLGLGLEHATLEDFAPIFCDGAIDWAREPDAALPRRRFRTPVDAAARAIAAMLDLDRPIRVDVSACAAGALAVAQAASLIERGVAEVVITGAADSMVNPLGVAGMARLGAPSPRHELDACRPFDRARDGLVIGEGAAVFVVESEARARARGARPLARILGWGRSQDGYRLTAPRPDGTMAARAMTAALHKANLAPSALGYINAHGTGTPAGDVAECRAIRAALGPHAATIPISSIKGAVGHLMAAAGALELAASLLAFQRDLLPGTAHLRTLDPDCDLDIIGPTPRPARIDTLMSNSFGFGGQNAALILGRVQDPGSGPLGITRVSERTASDLAHGGRTS